MQLWIKMHASKDEKSRTLATVSTPALVILTDRKLWNEGIFLLFFSNNTKLPLMRALV